MLRSDPPQATPPQGPPLQRSLQLWHLVVYGIIIIQPTAPMGIYGVVSNIAHGHVVTALLIGMVAMLFTAVSYGRMARVYPQAGSAFTYVSQEIHPRLGYLVGWAMLMDYLLNPIICVIWCSQASRNFLPDVPYAFWVVLYTALSTLLNTRGIQTSSRINALLALVMTAVVTLFLGQGVHYILLVVHPSHAQLIQPFYDRATFSASSLFRGTSVAVLTYIGFDGISTMAEEVENPRRNIMLATVLTCLVIGILSAVQVYIAQLAWPATAPFPAATVDTAFVSVAHRVGGPALGYLLNGTLLVANLGSGIAAQFGAARLMYGMGRDGSLPRRIFATIDPTHQVPRNNVLILGALVLAGAFLLTYEQGAELLNFGALLAFIGVNAAALVHYRPRSHTRPHSDRRSQPHSAPSTQLSSPTSTQNPSENLADKISEDPPPEKVLLPTLLPAS
ncbi:MAG TPA: APC family permease, partial [Acidobacteriaceae bacterium]